MKLTATAPDGSTVSRRTENDYKFTVVKNNGFGWIAVSWHSRKDLAVKAATRVNGWTVIVPVNAAKP